MILGLPIPSFSIVEVPGELVARSLIEDIWELGEGLAFGSERVEMVQEIGPSILTKIPEELQRRVLLFDWWVRNEDRHYTEWGGNPNLLWDYEAAELVVFDHNMAFDREFDVNRFKMGHAFRSQLPKFADREFKLQEGSRLAAACSKVEMIFQETPERWREGAPDFDATAVRTVLDRYQSPEFWSLES